MLKYEDIPKIGPEDYSRAIQTVQDIGVCIIVDLPTGPEELIEFGKKFGPISIKPSYGNSVVNREGPFAVLGDVRPLEDLIGKAPRPTQTTSEVPLHTARSASDNPCTLFMMLLVSEPSFGPIGNRGESRIARLADVYELYDQVFPNKLNSDIAELSSVPISRSSNSDARPILHRDNKGKICLRYWEGIRDDVYRSEVGKPFLEAFKRFDWALNHVAIEFMLEKNELIFLDNTSVAHARRSFPLWTRKGEEIHVSERTIHSVHIDA
ncbi:TauD/TfdA family dioxygenase [Bacillus cereus group sp. MYBK12-2]|uniref:TauD/TfdA-like domain-containing protein n=2 Tax=Bacillus cereus group TaxID=86661 RepID=A0A151V300_BACCE|nr:MULTISPECIES: TauD/TfdA family dioxygenase [Bacillus cereus group]EJR42873.1 hypothetical protein IIK_05390 [Bacillus cereus VD102]KLA01266.1 hypothetical protein B4153_3600 [Bacillus cereus]KMP90303.1 hypothetical protein TU63_04730 [Bacillus cereus]KXY22476.1 hypothetical protein AT273_08180 [Bacillus cereus]KYQ04318.1 hypothetical protein B4079_0509 [Bacillus cereus]